MLRPYLQVPEQVTHLLHVHADIAPIAKGVVASAKYGQSEGAAAESRPDPSLSSSKPFESQR